MIKTAGKAALREAHFRYMRALTDPPVRKLQQQGVLQLEFFDETQVEVRVGTTYCGAIRPRGRGGWRRWA